MKIKMLTLAAGPNGTMVPGSIYDLPAKEAKQYVAGGYALEVPDAEEALAPQRARDRAAATANAPENAMAPAAAQGVAGPAKAGAAK